MSHFPPPENLPVDVFHHTRPSVVIIGSNTDIIYARTFPEETVGARSDGWWGPHEYSILPQIFDETSPYLAWIPTPSAYEDPHFHEYTGLDASLALLSFDKFPLILASMSAGKPVGPPHHTFAGLPSRPLDLDPGKVGLSFVSTSEAMRAIVKEKVFALISAVRQATNDANNNPDLKSIRMPEQAIFRLQQAYYWNLLPGTVTTIGHVLVLAALKRAAYELHGFLLWLKDNTLTDLSPQKGQFKKPYKTRGVIVKNARDYHALSRMGVSVYMEADLNIFTLPRSAKETQLSPIPVHRQLLVPYGSRAGHHTFLYFYPPIVEDFALFELAARGYASRLDNYEPNKGIDRLHAQLHKDTGGSLLLRVRVDSYNIVSSQRSLRVSIFRT
jgi:hypothetical protein